MSASDRAVSMMKAMLPAGMRRRRLLTGKQPASRCFGLDRGGTPIDRHYIDTFLAQHARDIHGRTLEIGDDSYTRRFGGSNVRQADVLHVHADNPAATIVGDLQAAHNIPSDTFDCFICTQSLMFMYDVRAAVDSMRRVLKPGGVALATVAGISQICRWDMDRWGDFWRFTSLSAKRLFSDVFGEANIAVQSYGNSFAAVALLQGLTAQELSKEELDRSDRDYEIIIAIRAVKVASPTGGA